MQLDHERLDVYELALEFLVLANGILSRECREAGATWLTSSRGPHLSIVLNLAEGAGKHGRLAKRRGVDDQVNLGRQAESLTCAGRCPLPEHWSHFSAARPLSLASGEAFARTGAERTWVREHRTGAKTKPEARISGRGHHLK
jgi:hypothetical protein